MLHVRSRTFKYNLLVRTNLMNRVVLLAVALVTTGLAGCLGGEDGNSGENVLKNRATVSESAGGVEGIITDAAVQPVEGATVTVRETGASTRSASDGSYAFSNVLPGTYTLAFEATGFVGTEEQVVVRSGAVSTSDVILAHVPSIVPFQQQYEFTGFVECSVATPVFLVAVCSIPNIFVENATNDRFLFTFPLEADAHQVVVEMQWEPSTAIANSINMVVEPDGISNDDDVQLGEANGGSPLHLSVSREMLKAMDTNMTDVCKGDKEAGGLPGLPNDPESYCRPSYIEEGGPVQIRLFVSGEDPHDLGLAVQQQYHLVVTVFYHAPACEDFSVFAANVCPQGAVAVNSTG